MKLINNYWFRWFIGAYLVGEIMLVVIVAILSLHNLPGGLQRDSWIVVINSMKSTTVSNSSTGGNFAVGWPAFAIATALFGVGAGLLGLTVAAIKRCLLIRSSPNHRPHKRDNL